MLLILLLLQEPSARDCSATAGRLRSPSVPFFAIWMPSPVRAFLRRRRVREEAELAYHRILIDPRGWRDPAESIRLCPCSSMPSGAADRSDFFMLAIAMQQANEPCIR